MLLTRLLFCVCRNVRRQQAADHQALDVAHGVPPPRAAPPLLRRVVLSHLPVWTSCRWIPSCLYQRRNTPLAVEIYVTHVGLMSERSVVRSEGSLLNRSIFDTLSRMSLHVIIEFVAALSSHYLLQASQFLHHSVRNLFKPTYDRCGRTVSTLPIF